jgi:hypothetical protein
MLVNGPCAVRIRRPRRSKDFKALHPDVGNLTLGYQIARRRVEAGRTCSRAALLKCFAYALISRDVR